jgi:uncharacterized protein YfdQ (DUF2303 family)
MDTDTETGAVAALAVKAAGTIQQISTPDGRLLIALPSSSGGYHLQDESDPLRPMAKPPHIVQTVTLQTLESLVEYGKRFRQADTILFADIDANAIRAVIDYHGPAAPDRVQHKANLQLPFSAEWKTWTGVHGQLVDQLSFARFLEENSADIVAPAGADLLEVCRDLHAIRTVDFRKAVRTQTDNESFEYSDNTETKSRSTGESVEVPSKFQLSIPVYFGEAPVSIFAFLRWKVSEGKLELGVQLHRAEHVRQAVFKQIVIGAAELIERPAIFGKLG